MDDLTIYNIIAVITFFIAFYRIAKLEMFDYKVDGSDFDPIMIFLIAMMIGFFWPLVVVYYILMFVSKILFKIVSMLP